jgi:hypothetical protein
VSEAEGSVRPDKAQTLKIIIGTGYRPGELLAEKCPRHRATQYFAVGSENQESAEYG